MQRKRIKSRFKWFLLSTTIVVLLIMGLLQTLQEKIIFLPTKLDLGYEYKFAKPFEELFLTANDGARLNALHFKADSSKGIIVYFHGNAGDLSRWGEIVQDFVAKNWDVLVMDYRSYGKSTGTLNEANFYSDAQLFYDYAKEKFPQNEIIIYGRSLGCVSAIKVAQENSASKLVLETPFYNLYDIAKQRFPFLPVDSMLKYKFENNKNIVDVDFPIIIFQGTEDEVVPYDSAKRLFDLVENDINRFITINGGAHNNLVEFEEYKHEIDRLLESKK